MMRGKTPVNYDERIDQEYQGKFDPAKPGEA
jgi:hypothetical protein